MKILQGLAVVAVVTASIVCSASGVRAGDSTETCCGPPTETPPPAPAPDDSGK